MRSRTHAAMMARSGNMQMMPIRPVKVTRGCDAAVLAAPTPSLLLARTEGVCTGGLIMAGSDTEQNRAIVAYAYPRTQGADCAPAGAARGVSVLQRGRRHDLRREGAGAA